MQTSNDLPHQAVDSPVDINLQSLQGNDHPTMTWPEIKGHLMLSEFLLYGPDKDGYSGWIQRNEVSGYQVHTELSTGTYPPETYHAKGSFEQLENLFKLGCLDISAVRVYVGEEANTQGPSGI